MLNRRDFMKAAAGVAAALGITVKAEPETAVQDPIGIRAVDARGVADVLEKNRDVIRHTVKAAAKQCVLEFRNRHKWFVLGTVLSFSRNQEFGVLEFEDYENCLATHFRTPLNATMSLEVSVLNRRKIFIYEIFGVCPVEFKLIFGDRDEFHFNGFVSRLTGQAEPSPVNLPAGEIYVQVEITITGNITSIEK
jgi:hypothetical protein